MAQYYGLPWLSYRAVSWHERQEGQPGFSPEDTMLVDGGNIHPNVRGHGCGALCVRGLPQSMSFLWGCSAKSQPRAVSRIGVSFTQRAATFL